MFVADNGTNPNLTTKIVGLKSVNMNVFAFSPTSKLDTTKKEFNSILYSTPLKIEDIYQ